MNSQIISQVLEWSIGTTWTADGYVTFQGAPVDITGATIEMRAASPSELLFMISTADNITIVDGPGGYYRINVPPDSLAQIASKPGPYDFEVDVVTLDGAVTDPSKGKLNLDISLRVKFA